MPFIFGQINSRYGKNGGAEIVRSQMIKYAGFDKNSQLINTSTESSWNDFPKYTDNVHYNTEGQKRLGIAFAKAYFNLIK